LLLLRRLLLVLLLLVVLCYSREADLDVVRLPAVVII
jgi:hypothetical protein